MPPVDSILETRLPVWNAGMGGIAGPRMAAAMAEAGGMGVLGAGGMPPPAIAAFIAATRGLTDLPFAANVIMPMIKGGEIEACIDAEVPVLVLFWGDPAPWIEPAHSRGVKVVLQCGAADEAERAAKLGVDAVIVQGTEAGGHVKATAPLREVLGETLARIGTVPVIAAGGITHGHQVAELLGLGAFAVSLGTRFLCTTEAEVFPEYQQRVVAAEPDDTLLTKLFDVGWPDAAHRVVRNGAIARWEAAGSPASGQRPGEAEIIGSVRVEGQKLELPRYTVLPALTGFEGDLDSVPLYAGLSCGGIDRVADVAEVMANLKREIDAA